MTVLGISIGTRSTGICVLDNGTIVDANLHEYHEPWSDTKLHVIISQYRQYIRKYQVLAVIVMVAPPDGQTPAIRRIMGQVGALAKRYHCAFDYTTNLELKSTYGLAGNGDVPAKVKALYPAVTVAMSEHQYYKRFYEAILAAHFYQERLKKRSEQQ